MHNVTMQFAIFNSNILKPTMLQTEQLHEPTTHAKSRYKRTENERQMR